MPEPEYMVKDRAVRERQRRAEEDIPRRRARARAMMVEKGGVPAPRWPEEPTPEMLNEEANEIMTRSPLGQQGMEMTPEDERVMRQILLRLQPEELPIPPVAEARGRKAAARAARQRAARSPARADKLPKGYVARLLGLTPPGPGTRAPPEELAGSLYRPLDLGTPKTGI